MINVEQMLNIGRDCGLITVYEAWSQVQGHWDTFFEYDKFAEQQVVLNYEMFEKGLLELSEEGKTRYKWPEKDETIVDAMNRLGMVYVEPDWDNSGFDNPEEGDGVL